MEVTYIADKDSVTLLRARNNVVGEGVRRHRDVAVIAARIAETTAATVTIAATASETATAAITEATTGSTVAATTTKARAAHAGVGEAILTHLDDATVPLVAVELLNGVASILGGLKYDDTRALGPAIGAHVDIGANDGALTSWTKSMYKFFDKRPGVLTGLAEEILQILPANVEGQLRGSVRSRAWIADQQ